MGELLYEKPSLRNKLLFSKFYKATYPFLTKGNKENEKFPHIKILDA